MNKTFTLAKPTNMPDRITIETGETVQKQDGFDSASTSNSIDVKSLSENEAEEYGELMKQTFIGHWRAKQS